ncbi:MAG: hypothetical protein ACLP7P_00850 [Rhodomicrobium sp.]
MKHRVFLLLPIFALCMLSCAAPGLAQAAPLSVKALAAPVQQPSILHRTGQGCGWDYACPPRPDFGRRSFRQGDVYIDNNYGPVNIFTGGPRGPEPGAGFMERRDCGAPGCAGGTDCGGYPCDEKCGPLCWMRRFKSGYCGHGCWAYREQARIEAEEREERRERRKEKRERRREERLEEREEGIDYPPSYYDRDYPLPPRYSRRRSEAEPAPPSERPAPGAWTPRERFDGPRYPADCPRGGC